jgi:hypothetical protein
MAIEITTVPPKPAAPVFAITGLSKDSLRAIRDLLYFLNDATRIREFPELQLLWVLLRDKFEAEDDDDQLVLETDNGDIKFKRLK